MYWIRRLEEELSQYEEMEKGEGRGELTRGIINIYLNLLVRFLMSTDANMKVVPNQWEVATYHGDRRWEIFDEFDFGSVGELILIDDRPHGAGVFGEFYQRRGEEHFRIGFLLPQRIGEGREFSFYVVETGVPSELTAQRIWEGLRGGVEKWHESLLRKDSSPLRQYCEKHLTQEASPRIPDNI